MDFCHENKFYLRGSHLEMSVDVLVLAEDILLKVKAAIQNFKSSFKLVSDFH